MKPRTVHLPHRTHRDPALKLKQKLGMGRTWKWQIVHPLVSSFSTAEYRFRTADLKCATQNQFPFRKRQKLRKSPKKARLLVLVQVWPLHPLDLPRNESGSLADRLTFTALRLGGSWHIACFFTWFYSNCFCLYLGCCSFRWLAAFVNGSSDCAILCE